MGSYYQSLSYLKGGNTRKTKGGFYPSIMGGVAKYGSYLLPVALRHGTQLIHKHKLKKTRKTQKSKKTKKSKTMRKK